MQSAVVTKVTEYWRQAQQPIRRVAMARSYEKQLKQVIDPVLAKAFSHSLRGHVLVTLCEKGVGSPKEIADELEIDVSEVSYHFRELKRRKLIRLVRTVPRRGFFEHFYEPSGTAFYFDDEEWMEVPAALRSALSGETLKQIVDGMSAALEAGSFEAHDGHLSQSWLLVDRRGWREVMETMQGALDRVQEIREACAKRRGPSPSEPQIATSVVIAAFETAASVAQREPGESVAS
jgi:DNA-binding MarR family transcriptional regulator